jgi:hypothetical protein
MSHTRGPVKVINCVLGYCVCPVSKTRIFDRIVDDPNMTLENANFIADAFNVAHETGLTPREMADVLKKMIVEYEHGHGVDELIWFVQERIAKAEGGAE